MDSNEFIPIGNKVKIRKRGKKGTWVAHFHHDGDHRKRSLKTANKKVAVERAIKLENELQDGTYQSSDSEIKIKEAIERYIECLTTAKKARKTVVRYQGVLTKLCEFAEKKKKRLLRQINATLFDQFRVERTLVVCENTLYHEGTICKTFLYWCVSRGLLKLNPLEKVKLNKPKPRRRPSPSLQDVQKILQDSTAGQSVLYTTLAYTGMRSGELRTLRKEDVDLKQNWIHVVSREDAERTKTGESRKIPVHPELRKLLEKRAAAPGPWYFTAEPSNKYPAGDHWINPKKLNERFLGVAERVKLPTGRDALGYTLHSLRHFFETHCVNQGIPQRVIDTWMGHQSDRSMAAVYYHLSDEDSQAFMQQVDFTLPSTDSDD
tara:strand:- start:60483 stop:61613 length:1131 start_codon:yes stop_codon:yes gene_type:complete